MALAVVMTVAMTAPLGCTRETRPLPPCDSSAELPQLRGKRAIEVVAAGDVADCSSDAHHRTAALIERIKPDVVLGLGDLAYPNGSLDEYVDCYGSSWGKFRSITRAAVGNHEYHTPHAGPFFAYFCGSSGEPYEGWYSFELGAWHVVVLNSNCGTDLDVPASVKDEFGGCRASSPQGRWLTADLDAHPSKCTLAMWHHPRFTSGVHGNAEYMRDAWRILDAHGADLMLAGHVHNYERFAPLDADGAPHPTGRMREISVGTGGRGLTGFAQTVNGSEVRDQTSHGVLHLTLRETSYAWEFVPVDGDTFTDRGEAACGD
jgi:3',5'-cyclic AMP phosphodiesterase CpdA